MLLPVSAFRPLRQQHSIPLHGYIPRSSDSFPPSRTLGLCRVFAYGTSTVNICV